MSAALPVVVLNAGSSSIKFAILIDEQPLCRGLVDRIALADASPHARVRGGDGQKLIDQDLPGRDHEGVLDWLMEWSRHFLAGREPVAVGHRVVHGADRFSAPTRVTSEVLEALEAFVPLAPLHQPHNLAPIRYLARRSPSLPQVACFDTAFHTTQPRLARMFALPLRYFDRGIKRYGFHGLSYEYIASQLPHLDVRAAEGRTVVCHLGNGASMCAMLAGKSIATTMGFTALEGLMMGTRCGAIDPGVLFYLLEHDGLRVEELNQLLYRESGLLGVSGISSDMRDLLASDVPQAAEAVSLFCYRIARELGSLAAALGGLDAVVFTGGIGENAAAVRARVCDLSSWLGIAIDATANRTHAGALHTPESRVSVLVVPTDEERMIARHTLRLTGSRT